MTAVSRFGAILDSLLTPRNQMWHRLKASDPTLNEMREVREWFDEVTRRLFGYRYSPRANFAAQNQMQYISLGTFGSSCTFIDQLDGSPGIRYRHLPLSDVFFAENHQGIVDEVFRRVKLTARQAIQRFGEPGYRNGSKIYGLPDRVVELAKNDPKAELEFIHRVKPREEVEFHRADFRKMAYASHYVLKEGQHLVSEGGYTVFPFAVSRWVQAPGEVYGRSPAMDVLPAVKTLNEQKKTLLKAGHRVVDPVLLAHDDGILDEFDLRPGAVNYGGVSADGRLLVQPLATGKVEMQREFMDVERAAINDAFLITLFQILVETPTMTATEVLERTREKGILLAPTVGRQADEYLGPMIEREVNLLHEQGLLPDMPQALAEAGAEFRIEFDSPMSRAQRAEQAGGFLRSVEKAAELAGITQDPSILDNFDLDRAIREIADIQGTPERWLNDEQKMETIREQRAAQQEAAAQIQAAPGAAALTKAQAVADKEAREAAASNGS